MVQNISKEFIRIYIRKEFKNTYYYKVTGEWFFLP